MTRFISGVIFCLALLLMAKSPLHAEDFLPFDLTNVGEVSTTGDGRLLADIGGTGLDRQTRISLVRAFGNSDLVKGRLKLFSTIEDMVRADDLLYLANNTDGLIVVDVSRPDMPEVLASLRLPGRAWRILVRGDLALVLSVRQGLHLVNVANPESPRLIRTLPLDGVAFDMVANDRYLYLASVRQGIRVFRFSGRDLESKGLVRTGAEVWELELDGDRLVATHGREGLGVYRGADSGNISLIQGVALPDICKKIARLGEHRFAVRGQRDIFIVDFSTKRAPQIGTYRKLAAASGGMAVRGDILFLGGSKGLFVAPIAPTGDLLAPGMVAFPSGVRSMLVDGHYLWVADQDNSLDVLDLNVDLSIADRSILHLGGRVADMGGQGQRIFLTGGDYDLQVVRMMAGGRLVPEGRMVDRLPVVSAATLGDLLCLGTADRQLLILDMTSGPVERERIALPGRPYDMSLQGDSLYIAAGSAGVLHYRVTGSSGGDLVGALATPFKATRLVAKGDHLYVADRQGGILWVKVDVGGGLREEGYQASEARLVDIALAGGRLYAVTADGRILVYSIGLEGQVEKGPWTMQLPGAAVQVVGNDKQLLVRLRNGELYHYLLSGLGQWKVPQGPVLLIDKVDSVHLQPQGLVVVQANWRVLVYEPSPDAVPLSLVEVESPATGLKAMMVQDTLLVYDSKDFVAFWPMKAVDKSWIHFGGEGQAIAVKKSLVAIASLSQLRLVAVSEDGDPRELARLSLPGRIMAIRWHDKMAACFVSGGVVLVDCTDPSDPRIAGTFPIEGRGRLLVVGRDRLLVATVNHGFFLLDISDPARPVLLDRMRLAEPVDALSRPAHLVARKDYVYVADHMLGLLVLHLSEDGRLELVTTIATGGTPYTLALAGGQLYLSDWRKGVMVFDISSPEQPELVAVLPGTAGCRHLQVTGDRILINDDKLKALYSLPLPDRGKVLTASPEGIRVEVKMPEAPGRYLLFAAGDRYWDLLPLVDVDFGGQVRLIP